MNARILAIAISNQKNNNKTFISFYFFLYYTLLRFYYCIVKLLFLKLKNKINNIFFCLRSLEILTLKKKAKIIRKMKAYFLTVSIILFGGLNAGR